MDKDLETTEVVELGDAKELTKGPYFPGPQEDNPEFLWREFP
jgi:hypothetical protein